MKRLLFAIVVVIGVLAVPSMAKANHLGTGFDSFTVANNQSATCDEASIYSAAAINHIWGAGTINGGVKGNCAGPHPNGSAKYQQWTNAAGNRYYDCLYDEDAGSQIFVDCRNFSIRTVYAFAYHLGFPPVDGVASCGEASLWTAWGIDEEYGSGTINGGTKGNCAGPHPNGSAKYQDWVGANGTYMYQVLYDEDPPSSIEVTLKGPNVPNTFRYILHR